MRNPNEPDRIRRATPAAQRNAALVRAMLAFLRPGYAESQNARGATVHSRSEDGLTVSRTFRFGYSMLSAELAGHGVVAVFRLDVTALSFQTRTLKAPLLPEWAGLVGLPSVPHRPAKTVPFSGGSHAH
jgi:hypothetical protein